MLMYLWQWFTRYCHLFPPSDITSLLSKVCHEVRYPITSEKIYARWCQSRQSYICYNFRPGEYILTIRIHYLTITFLSLSALMSSCGNYRKCEGRSIMHIKNIFSFALWCFWHLVLWETLHLSCSSILQIPCPPNKRFVTLVNWMLFNVLLPSCTLMYLDTSAHPDCHVPQKIYMSVYCLFLCLNTPSS